MTTPTLTGLPQITFGDRVRRLRLDVGMTQDEFADAIGVGRATIGKYELLREAPRTYRLMRNSLELRFGSGVAEWVMTGGTGPTPGGVWVTQRDYAVAA